MRFPEKAVLRRIIRWMKKSTAREPGGRPSEDGEKKGTENSLIGKEKLRTKRAGPTIAIVRRYACVGETKETGRGLIITFESVVKLLEILAEKRRTRCTYVCVYTCIYKI